MQRQLLAKPEHRTCMGPIRIDRSIDGQARFHVFLTAADHPQ